MLTKPPGRGASRIVALFLAGHFTHHLVTAIHQPLLPLIRADFELDYFRAGLVVSAFAVPYGLSQLPMGWLADRVGRRRLLSLGMIGIAVVAFAVGFSTGFWQLVVLLALMGLFGGAYHPSAAPLISQAVPANRLGRALGIHIMGGSASFFLTPLMALGIALTMGWRGPFLILAIPTFLAGFLFLRILRREPGVPAPAPAEEKEGGALGALLRRLGLLVGVSVLTQSVTMAIIAFVPMFLVDKHALSPAYAGMFLSLIYGAGLVAAPAGGMLSDRLGRRPIILFSVIATGPVIYLFTIAPFGPTLIALFVLLGMVMYIRQPVLESMIVQGVPAKRMSSFLGIYYFGSIESASVVAPVVGLLMDRIGPDRTFALLGGIVLAASLAVALLMSGRAFRSRGAA
ncbi:MAG: MFS transporter [Dehalococcoidia bacterium]